MSARRAPDVVFETADPAAPPAATLIAAMRAEIRALYGAARGRGPSATPAELSPPGGVCLVGYRGGAAVCVGGVKCLPGAEGTGEIKRMYVVPEARGAGIARALLAALEGEARRLGYRSVRLDTGSRQPHARALYDSVGYREIPDYNENPHASFWGERAL